MPTPMQTLAFKLMDYLYTHELWCDCAIYVDNDRYRSTSYPNRIQNPHLTPKGTPYVLEEDLCPLDYVEYANVETLTMTFEGPLYDMLNGGGMDTYNDLDEMFRRAGYYMEFGYAWSLSLYPLD